MTTRLATALDNMRQLLQKFDQSGWVAVRDLAPSDGVRVQALTVFCLTERRATVLKDQQVFGSDLRGSKRFSKVRLMPLAQLDSWPLYYLLTHIAAQTAPIDVAALINDLKPKRWACEGYLRYVLIWAHLHDLVMCAEVNQKHSYSIAPKGAQWIKSFGERAA